MFLIRKRIHSRIYHSTYSTCRRQYSSNPNNNKKPHGWFPKPTNMDQQDDDAFISSLFYKTSNWLPNTPWLSVDEFNTKISQLYPALTQQLKEGYERLWDYLTMEEFRKMVEELENESHSIQKYPELALDATVRRDSNLSRQETDYLVKRKRFQKTAFARLIGRDPSEIDERDLPVIGIASSGGGYRAMIGLTGYLNAFKQTGVWDCSLYLSGISGSCWAMSLYYNPFIIRADTERLREHLKEKCQVHWANMSNFLHTLTLSPEHTKAMIRGIIQRGQRAHLVDVFGALMGSRLFNNPEMSTGLSSQQKWLENGQEPMPIYCVVRHMVENDQSDVYQWFEFTPYDMGCEELEAWIPTWAFGRRFQENKNMERLPEQSLDIMNGTFGSAFAASLVHFYQEIRSFLPKGALEKMDQVVKQYELSMSNIHPISPSSFPNPFGTEDLQLMDAGMDNNIPFYPLLRQGRDVDIILAVDLSADIQTAPHFKRAESYMKRRGIEGWPKDARWPSDEMLGSCTVFEGQATGDQTRPITLIYFPFILNEAYDSQFDPQTAEFCSTWNFVYKQDQVDKVIGLAEANVNQNIEKIRKVLLEAWQRKKKQRLLLTK